MLANLRALFGVVFNILLLRQGPEHLPVSQMLLVVIVALCTLASALMGATLGVPPATALMQSLLASAVMLLWYHLALGMAHKRERFLQTMTALFAINLLFIPLLIPVLGQVLPYMQKPDPANPPPALALLMVFGLGLWGLVVEVRIVRSALEIHWVGGLLLIFGEFLAATFITMLLFGGAGKAA